jgi:CAI-1 autoinducer synthase
LKLTADDFPELLRERLEWFEKNHSSRPEVVRVYGQPGPDSVRLFTNDYLSLASHPTIVAACVDAIQKKNPLWMSAVFFGEESPQRHLERRFAEYLGTEDAVISQSGYAANLGVLHAIGKRRTNVYLDHFAHASAWHGAFVSLARTYHFEHNDAADLRRLIKLHGSGIVVVDSIYSHDGSECPLGDIIDVGTAGGCVLIVDESHSLGVRGPQGRGSVAEIGAQNRVHFITASLAKAFVGRAGLIGASANLCHLLKYNAGPAIFSSACMDHDFAGLNAALDLIAKADDLRASLLENAHYLRHRLHELGYHITPTGSQIIPLIAGDEAETVRVRQILESCDVFGSGYCEPATPKNQALVRLSVNASLRKEELDKVVAACEQVRKVLDITSWPLPANRLYKTAEPQE